MKNTTFIEFILVFIVFTFFACSSSNDRQSKTLPEVQNGNNLMESANYFLKINDFNTALETYNQAFTQFTLVDHLEGKFLASLGIIKTSILLGKLDNAQTWLNKIKMFTKVPDKLLDQVEFSLIEFHFSKKEYEIVKQLTDSPRISESSRSLYLPLAAYRAQALLTLNLDYSKELKMLLDIVQNFQEDKNSGSYYEPSDISYIYYTLGYIRSKEKKWESANSLFSRSLEIAKQIGDYKSIADNLFALGLVNKELGRLDQALDHFQRSSEIYQILKATSSAELTEAKMLITKILMNKNDSESIQKIMSLLSSTKNDELRDKIQKFLSEN